MEDLKEFKADGLLGLAPIREADKAGNRSNLLDKMKE